MGNGTIPTNSGKSKLTAVQRPLHYEKIQQQPTDSINGKTNIHASQHTSSEDQWDAVSKAGARIQATQQRNNRSKNQGGKTMPQIKAGKYGWMPELNKAIQMVLYWKGIEKCQKGGKIGKDTLTR